MSIKIVVDKIVRYA